MDHQTTVLIADSSEEFCTALAAALQRADGFQVVGTAGDGEQAIRLINERKPQVLVLDLMLSKQDGISVLKASKYEASHKIRFLRVVVDYDVDRMQVYRQRCHSRALLIARPLFAFRVWRYIRSAIYGHFTFFSSCLPYSGDYSTGVPPLPIPNREVKPGHADGTA